MQSALLKSQREADNKGNANNKQLRIFFYCAAGLCIWQMFPEYLFPMTSSLAFLCWAAPYNETINFVGSGLGGIGFMNLTLDWANVTSLIMLYPYWVQVIQFIGFVLGAWVMIPIAKWSLLVNFKHGLMSNRLFTSSGSLYPTDKLLDANGSLNTTAYHYYGPVNLGAQRSWNMFFDYAAYTSGITWVLLFSWAKLKGQFGKTPSYNDRINKLNNAYSKVPTFWYTTMFAISLIAIGIVHINGYLYMPLWACGVALVVGSIIVTPLMWLYAISNFQLPIGTFNELLYGYLVQGLDLKHPAGAAFFGCVAGNAWYRSQFHLELMKLGFYNFVPPKDIFFAQVFGELIGVPINFLSMRWVLSTKWEFLSGKRPDPLHQWTAQTVITYHSNAIQYVVLGPKRLFENYRFLPFGLLAGVLTPLIVFVLHRRFPLRRIHLWNTTVLFSTLSHFYGNISTGHASKFIGGTVTMYYFFHYKKRIWEEYNYVVAAALDTGYNMSMSIIFALASLDIRAPHWFGNNAQNVERCFAI